MPEDEVDQSGNAADSAQSGRPRGPRRRPRGYGLVLLTIVLAIVIASLGQLSPVSEWVSLLLIGAALLLALRTAEVHPRTQRLAAALVGIALVVGLLSSLPLMTFVPGSLVLVIGATLIAATSIVLAGRLVQNPEVTRQAIVGALCVYLLIGLFFAFVFGATSRVTGTPFFASIDAANSADYLYFSFVTLATVGYGDLVARSNLGRMLAATEGLTGQLYLVTVVALLVSNLNRPGHSRQD
jgi:hypothetical protein